jgi:hypothetical protein
MCLLSYVRAFKRKRYFVDSNLYNSETRVHAIDVSLSYHTLLCHKETMS